MSWKIKYDGTEFDSDDFTIAELGMIERQSQTPWSIANAFKSVDVAKAFLTVAMRRQGMLKPAIDDALEGMTLKTLKNSFEWVSEDDDEETAAEPDPSVPSLSSITPESSPGEQATGGSPAKRSKSA